MKTQIPIYRAKKIDSDEWVEGYYTLQVDEHSSENHLIIVANAFSYVGSFCTGCITSYTEIDPSTLAIHFPSMIAHDSNKLLPNGEKDLRIFASLNEDGKGGDICLYDNWEEKTAIYHDSRPMLKGTYLYLLSYECTRIKITGIQKCKTY